MVTKLILNPLALLAALVMMLSATAAQAACGGSDIQVLGTRSTSLTFTATGQTKRICLPVPDGPANLTGPAAAIQYELRWGLYKNLNTDTYAVNAINGTSVALSSATITTPNAVYSLTPVAGDAIKAEFYDVTLTSVTGGTSDSITLYSALQCNESNSACPLGSLTNTAFTINTTIPQSATAPSIAAAFSPTTITTAQTSTLTLTITNTNASVAITGVAVAAAALPVNLTGSSAATTCSGGTASYNNGTRQLSLSGGSLAAGTSSSCTVTLTVSSSTASTYGYTTGAVSSTESGNGTTATTPTQLTVNALSSTTTAVSSSLNPSNFSQSVTFTATVSSGSSPSGTVTFKDGATSIGTGTLSGGTATLSTSALTVGAHTITAVYDGDTNNTTSTSSAITQTVNALSTTTTVSSSLNPSNFGQSVTFTATVSGGSSPSGTVTFKDGATSIGTGTLSGGTATLSTSALTVGAHTITAVYDGDTNNTTSTSSAITQTVNALSTTTAVSSSLNPSNFGQSVTFTATVSGGSSPSGTVTFKDGATSIGTGTLSGGTATLSTSALTVGAHTITAVYDGDTNNTTSTSSAITQTVNALSTTTTVSSSLNPSNFGQSVTFTATVSGGSSPSGTVTFKDGATSIGTGTLSGGTATLSTSALTVGAHTITAVYDGDSSNATSTSSSITQTVNALSTTTAVSSSLNPSNFGQSVTFTATVSGGSSPSGTVTFKDGATSIGTGTLSGGTATLSTSALTVGAHTITAVYDGDTNNTTSTSAIVTQTVNMLATTTSIVSSLNPVVLGQSVTFTATISGGSSPSGTVTFKDGATTLGTGTVSGGTATYSTAALTAGPHSITAVYGGDTNNATSTSAGLTQSVITIIPTTTTLTSSATTALSGQSVTLTATITPAPTGGTVSFTDGGTTLCAAVPVTSGVAACATSFTGGTHNVIAAYSGSSTHGASTSAALAITVNDQTQQTAQAIATFMSHRNDLIAANSFDEMREIDRLNEVNNGSGTDAGGNTFTEGATPASPSAGAQHLGMGDMPEIAGFVANQIAGMTSGARSGRGSTQSFTDQMALGLQNQDRDTVRATGGPVSATGSGDDTSLRFGFSTSLSAIMKNEAAKEQEKIRAAGSAGLEFAGNKSPSNKAAAMPFDVWVEGRYTGLTNSGALDGHFGLLTLGADYVVSRSLLVGAYVQYDDMSETNDTRRTKVESRGWMAGPYATLRLTDHLFWQSRGAWGKSDVDVSPFQTYTDSFETTRWIASTKLTGRWQIGPWTLSPQASVSYLSDTSDAYRDTFGALIPKVKSELGQMKIGPEVGYTYQTVNGIVLEPRGKLELIWDFADDTTAQGLNLVVDDAASLGDVRGRAELGLRAQLPGGIGFDLSGAYDGIGSSGSDAITGKAMLRVPLN